MSRFFAPLVFVLGLIAGQGAHAQVASYAFSEGTGTTTADNSGNGRTGTLTNTAWATTGRVGNALTFNGSSARVDVADANSLDLTSAMTLEAWVFPTSSSGTRTVIYKERSGGYAYALFASNGASPSRPAASVRIGSTNFTVTGTATLPLNTWSHLAVTYGSSALRLYVNGTQVAVQTVTGSITTTTNPLRIGGNTQASGQYFQGRIDEVRIFNTVRTAAQIQSDMNTRVDTTAPTISSRSPASGATGVSAGTAVTVTFNETMAAASINANTLQLRNAQGTLVAGTVSYATATRVATFTPSAALANGTVHTATVVGGASGVTDVSGNPLAANSSWSFTVVKGNTTTSVTSSANPAVLGQSVTLTATVAPQSPATGIPTGTVQFRIGTTNLGAPVALSGGTASLSTAALAVGTSSINAVYSSDAAFNASTSAALSQVIAKASTTTSVVSSVNPSNPGQTVTFTANVAIVAPGAGALSGTVQFQVDGANFGAPVALAGNSATLAAPSLSTGYRIVTATYGGNTNLAASTSSLLLQAVGVAACNGNVIVQENCLPGSPKSEWDVEGAGDPSIQGFATEISVNRGQTVSFKIDAAAAYKLDIYRMGYYAGLGARKVATIPSVPARTQPACLTQSSTGLIDCGNWVVSSSWQVPASATSGIYFARATRLDTGGASHIVFIVRDDTGNSALLFQTSDTTWQAYNSWGGNSLYTGAPVGRAYKVSYNRPFNTREVDNGQDWVFNAEYPMVRWLEANGYDVSYSTGVDTDRRGSLLLNHKVFLSVGHDEYWSWAQRANVEAVRNAGVHLAFFSGNEVFWKTRWENSIDGSGTPYRTLVSYKETHANAVIDPAAPIWTGTWRDPRFSPPGDGGRPENALTGQLFMANDVGGPGFAINVPEADGKMRFWRNTSVATLGPGQSATLPVGTLGYEWDSDIDNGSRPPGLFRMSTTNVSFSGVLQDYGSTYGSGTLTHNLTLYKHASGALVFGAGTVQWPWGLDAEHDRGDSPADVRMQQATVNLFADMGVQPATLQGGLVTATASTDSTPPTSTILAPAPGANLVPNTIVTITGTASDAGGGLVGGVEVSVDGGATWRRATGRTNWTYAWTTPATGQTLVVRSRAVDDSGNLETPSAGVTVTTSGTLTCPCSVWPADATPVLSAEPDDNSAVEVGVKFRPSINGYISAIRFYKDTTNVGPHVVHLWTAGGTLLSSAPMTSGTVSGWQQVTLPGPVPVNANTTYVASYHTASGHYADDQGYFSSSVTSGPITFLSDGEAGGNGVFAYGAPGTFPNQSFNGTNYWVDVVFAPTPPSDTTAPSVQSVFPYVGAVGTKTALSVTATFNELLNPGTIGTSTFLLRDASNNIVAASVAYDASMLRATLTPTNPLAYSSTYTVTVKGGVADPRVKDLAGNALASDLTWSFTTGAPPPPPPSQGPGGPILVVTSTVNQFTSYYAEILRAEGLNLFALADISTVSAQTLAAYDVVLLGQMPLTTAQVSMFTTWVNAGGRLIAMRPDKKLAGLLGLIDAGSTLNEGYLLIDTSTSPGAGLVGETIQYHGAADRYALNSGTTGVATLYTNATTATTAPAVTRRSVGSNGGEAVAFAYDLARSVVYTRQGNPAWAGQDRDGLAPMRSDDLFFGAAAGDPQTDWVDLNKVAIPQADEQQRLLANLIISMNQSRRPLPRFWYLPRGLAAAVVMTGDDHAMNGTSPRFESFKAASPSSCVVDNWECVRGTSYIYPTTPLSPSAAAAYVAEGFEIALHVNTNCADYTPASLESTFAGELNDWANRYQTLPPPATNRTHCIVWSDYVTQAQVSLAHDIRLDTNYYYWPASWVNNRPGVFTGSGMPMRFATANGEMIDVYQAATQLTDESGQDLPFTIAALLNKALGPEGYYGVFTANMHTDTSNPVADNGSAAIVAAAQARGVPVVSALQMLKWLDGRNNSKFGNITWNGTTLGFTISVFDGANGLQAMIPLPDGMQIATVTANGGQVPYSIAKVKGVLYAFVMASPGTYQVTFLSDTTPPTISSVSPVSGATGVNTDATLSAVFSEPLDPSTIGTATFELRDASSAIVPSTVTYAAANQRAVLTPANPLTLSTTYTATVKAGVQDLIGNPMGSDVSWTFTTVITHPPMSLWGAGATPANLDSGDPDAVELGVKFQADVPGAITAIRFYKGPNDTGNHVVKLWSANGVLLASANSTGETASGWQTVALPSPVAISANTVYVASYHTTAGRYPYNGAFFADVGIDNGVLHALSSPAAGGNGVYLYGSGGFPSNTYNATNYWVDVVFQR